MSGRVVLVGAGPGDPELITVRGARALAEADVVVYDRLVAPALLDLAHPEAERIYVGKEPGRSSMPQREIERLLVDRALGGAIVVRLKGGDPFVFGRGGEEVAACVAKGIPCEVVPGVSSAVAAPAAAGIPVTHRGVARSFAVVTGSTAHDDEVDLSKVAGADTLVVLMAAGRLAQTCADLIAAGRPADEPAAIVQWAWTPDQRSVVGTLADLPLLAEAASIGPPATLVVGAVAALGTYADQGVPSVAAGFLPGPVPALEVHHRPDTRPLQERRCRGRAHPGRAIDEEGSTGRERSDMLRQVTERDRHRTRDAAELELVRFPHVDRLRALLEPRHHVVGTDRRQGADGLTGLAPRVHAALQVAVEPLQADQEACVDDVLERRIAQHEEQPRIRGTSHPSQVGNASRNGIASAPCPCASAYDAASRTSTTSVPGEDAAAANASGASGLGISMSVLRRGPDQLISRIRAKYAGVRGNDAGHDVRNSCSFIESNRFVARSSPSVDTCFSPLPAEQNDPPPCVGFSRVSSGRSENAR